jgi:membrane protease YdiL (CAAX protease family)
MSAPSQPDPLDSPPAARLGLPELPLAPLGATTCLLLATAGFGVDQLVASLAWSAHHPVLGLAVGGFIGVIAPVAVILRSHGVRPLGLLGTRPSMAELGLVVWIVGAALPPLYALSGLVSRYFPPPESQLAVYRALVPEGWTDVLGGGLAVLVVAPLAEEILFRGLLLRGFAALVSIPIALVCGAVLFGASHGSLWLFPPLSLLGWLLGLVVWRTRGLAGAWLGHGLFNLVAYADLCITHDIRGARLEAWASRPWVWIPAAAVLGWGLARLRRGLPATTTLDATYLRD